MDKVKNCYKCCTDRPLSEFRPKRKMCNECIKAQKRNHYAENRERILDERKSLNGYFVRYKSQAKRRGYTFELDRETCYKLFQERCTYCGDNSQINGLDRIDNSKGYVTSNVQACCDWCNRMKWKYSEQEFYDKIAKILNRMI